MQGKWPAAVARDKLFLLLKRYLFWLIKSSCNTYPLEISNTVWALFLNRGHHHSHDSPCSLTSIYYVCHFWYWMEKAWVEDEQSQVASKATAPKASLMCAPTEKKKKKNCNICWCRLFILLPTYWFYQWKSQVQMLSQWHTCLKFMHCSSCFSLADI